MLIRDRVSAVLPGKFVVFLIGMRVNKPLLVHRWMPVAAAMPRMIRELYRQPVVPASGSRISARGRLDAAAEP